MDKKLSPEQKVKLRNERKAFVAYIVWFSLLLGLGIGTLKYCSQYLTQFGTFNYGQLLGAVIILLSLVCGVAGLIALSRISELIYIQPDKHFIQYLILVLLGSFFMGIFSIIVIFKVWFDAKKLL